MVFHLLERMTICLSITLLLTRIIQLLYYAPAGRYTSSSESADRGRSIIRVTTDGVFLLSAFKPSSSDSADRGHSIIRVTLL